MKVLHVAQALSRNFGGVQAVLHDLVKAQSEAGLVVDVVSTNVDAPTGVLPVSVNCFVEKNKVRIRYSSVQFRPLLFSMDFKSYIDQHVAHYDVVHIHGLYRFPPTYAACQARRKGVPYIICPHGALDPYLFRQSSRSVLLKRVYERWFDLPNLHAAGAIHYTSEEERTRAAYLALQAPSFVIPNGVDWERFESLPSRGAFRSLLGIGEEPLALFLGRLNFKKGLDLLIPAFAEMRRACPDVQLAIVGPDNEGYGTKVRQWVREYGLGKHVHFAGHLDGVNVIQAYVDADVFVLPSYTENFGMTVIEAMACRTPVVISDQVNIHQEITSAGAGLVTRCDVGDVARALVTIIENPALRKSMGHAGRQATRGEFTWPPIVKALTLEYEKVMAHTRSTRSKKAEMRTRSEHGAS